jgi:hypothetical protein
MTMFAKNLSFAAALALSAVLTASKLLAAPLLPGSAFYPPAEPDPIGGVVEDTMTTSFASATFTGRLTSTVISGDTSNPFGGFTFTYLLTNDAGSADAIGRMTVSSFATYLTDVSYQIGPGLPPTLASLAGPDVVMGFDFISAPIGPGMLEPGASSALLVVQTDSLLYDSTIASVINSTVASTPSFAPVPGAGVPEPATLSLAARGALPQLIRRRRA